MKALVLYDSFFGNTEQVARAMADSLGEDWQVECIKVNQVQPEQLSGLDLLIVGSPTRGFRPSELTSAFLKNLPDDALKGVTVAAFDTRIDTADIKSKFKGSIIEFFGYAAKPIANMLTRKGGHLVVSPEGFYVADREGPLKEGQLERAASWAQGCTRRLT